MHVLLLASPLEEDEPEEEEKDPLLRVRERHAPTVIGSHEGAGHLGRL